jgi:hypothetical protein
LMSVSGFIALSSICGGSPPRPKPGAFQNASKYGQLPMAHVTSGRAGFEPTELTQPRC